MAVYLIRCGEAGPVKLGKAADPHRRLNDLQTAHWEVLTLLRTWDGDEDEERFLHAHFSAHRLRGEWFSFVSEMMTIDVAPLVRPIKERRERLSFSERPGPNKPEHEKLLCEIEAFLSVRGWAETTFGMKAGQDGMFMRRLRQGANMTLRTFDKVRRFIREQSSAEVQSQTGDV